jgi:hypothetical protein
MRIYLVCTILVLYCLLISTISRSQIQKIYLHPKAAANGKLSQFVDSIRFIPLEVKEGIELGIHNRTEITEKYILIYDIFGQVVIIYSRSGTFIKKISYKKLGESFNVVYDEYANRLVFFGNNKNYSLTLKDRLKIKLDWNNPRNKKYFKKYTIDLNAMSFNFKKETPDQSDINGLKRLYDDYYLEGQIATSELFKDSLDYELKIYKNGQVVKNFFPYNRINEPRYLYSGAQPEFNKTDTPYTYFITRPYCDTIYRLNRDSLLPVYHLVLPLENSLPPSFFTRPFKNRIERENFERNNGWMLRQVYRFQETPKYIVFSVGYLSNYDSYIYQKQTNVTYKAKNIKSDSSQYNLQLLGEFSIARNGGKFYKPQKAGDLVAFFEKHKNVPVPKELESFIKSNPPASSPVIVEFKLKN